jgi:hypothetical protein
MKLQKSRSILRKTFQKKQTPSPFTLRKALAFIGILIVLVLGSGLFENVAVGQIGIALYGAYALIRKVPSSTTYTMAAITLVFMPVIALIREEKELVGTFGVYAYMLFVVAAISTVLEYWRNNRRSHKKVM